LSANPPPCLWHRSDARLLGTTTTALRSRLVRNLYALALDAIPSLQIRDIPDDLYQALSFRARQGHRSLTQQVVTELRRVPALTAGERRKAVVARIPTTFQQPDGSLRALHPRRWYARTGNVSGCV